MGIARKCCWGETTQTSTKSSIICKQSGCNRVNREKLNYAKALKGSTRSLNSKALNEAKYGLWIVFLSRCKMWRGVKKSIGMFNQGLYCVHHGWVQWDSSEDHEKKAGKLGYWGHVGDGFKWSELRRTRIQHTCKTVCRKLVHLRQPLWKERVENAALIMSLGKMKQVYKEQRKNGWDPGLLLTFFPAVEWYFSKHK